MKVIGLNLNENVVIVSIKDKYKQVLPLRGIKSRIATALVLGYLGYREKVIVLMQHISHRTRAYIQNTNFLHGFLVRGGAIVSILELANDSGELEVLTRWHVVDLEDVERSLTYFDTL